MNQALPGAGDRVEIDGPILLDIETPNLKRVIIADGGRIVFDPKATLAKLVSNNILIDDGGALVIGSKACEFTGNAEILLTGKTNELTLSVIFTFTFYSIGKRADGSDHKDFGQKYLGVASGGSLEIHGKDKLSWTRLTATLSPKSKIFSTETADLISEFPRCVNPGSI